MNRDAARIAAISGGTLASLGGSFEELGKGTGMTEKQLRAFAEAMPKLMSMQDSKESLDFVNKLLETTGLNSVEAFRKLTEGGKENVKMLVEYAQAGQVVNITLEELQKKVTDVEMATAGLGKLFNLTREDGDNLATSISRSMCSSFKSIISGTVSVKAVSYTHFTLSTN